MFIVCVTACPAGLAHTFMSAAALEKAAKKLGMTIKIETQGIGGIDNRITDEDLANTAGVILAADVTVVDKERFDGFPLIECAVSDPIKDAEEILTALKEEIESHE